MSTFKNTPVALHFFGTVVAIFYVHQHPSVSFLHLNLLVHQRPGLKVDASPDASGSARHSPGKGETVLPNSGPPGCCCRPMCLRETPEAHPGSFFLSGR